MLWQPRIILLPSVLPFETIFKVQKNQCCSHYKWFHFSGKSRITHYTNVVSFREGGVLWEVASMWEVSAYEATFPKAPTLWSQRLHFNYFSLLSLQNMYKSNHWTHVDPKAGRVVLGHQRLWRYFWVCWRRGEVFFNRACLPIFFFFKTLFTACLSLAFSFISVVKIP